ncbi:hypothetical protein [uncultured Roseobacter sp.]|uniref:hypothetical protein n=1 Tax=uncultured Roseobacter sp. TaxID=114847 RepID=UPI00263971B3|nr:hypothetical protein [uncultured Roseobacter sp.]
MPDRLSARPPAVLVAAQEVANETKAPHCGLDGSDMLRMAVDYLRKSELDQGHIGWAWHHASQELLTAMAAVFRDHDACTDLHKHFEHLQNHSALRLIEITTQYRAVSGAETLPVSKG